MRVTRAVEVLAGAVLAAAVGAHAVQTRTVLSAAADLREGYPQGVAAHSDGTFSAGPSYRALVQIPSLPLSALRTAEGLFVGTGPTGDLLRIQEDRAEAVHRFSEPLVTALAQSSDGSLLVGTSSPARVYRFRPGTGEVSRIASLPADYVWVLLEEGSKVLAATGLPGGIYEVSSAAEPTPVLVPPAKHVRCLAGWNGRLWAGTSGPAALYEVGGASPYCLQSFPQEEVAALAPSRDALFLVLNTKAAAAPEGDAAKAGGGGTSVVYRMAMSRVAEPVCSLGALSLSLCPSERGAFVGLVDGRLFEVGPQGDSYLWRWEDSPVTALLPSGPWPQALTAFPPALNVAEKKAGGVYLSPVLDLAAPARPVRLETSGGGTAAIRAGNTPKPDAFWSGWKEAPQATQTPPGRFVQWRLALAPGAESRGVSLSCRPINRPPLLQSALVHPPGQVSIQMPSQLGDRLAREVHQADAPFPSLVQAPAQDMPAQIYYIQGFRMISWKSEDPDGDKVRATLFLRPAPSGSWIRLAKDVADSFFAFDTRGLPDGAYSVRVRLDDAASNPEEESGTAERELPEFSVDNTPPDLRLSSAGPRRIRATFSDAGGVTAVRASVDGGPWQVLPWTEGVEGSASGACEVEVPSGEAHWVAVQAADPDRNVATSGWWFQPPR